MSPEEREFEEYLIEETDWRFTLMDTKAICVGARGHIKKRGGERQRSEGIEWLNRIIKRLDEKINAPFKRYNPDLPE